MTLDLQQHVGSRPVTGQSTVARVFVNTASLLTSDVLNRAATFAVYVLVARYSGARSFGQLSLGLMLLYTFQVFAAAGLPVLITREVAKRPHESGRYFFNASFIATCAFFVSLAILGLIVTVSRYPADTTRIVLLLGLGILPWSLTTVTNAVLQAWERMHVIVLVALPVNIAKVALCFWLLRDGRGVESIALVLLGCQVATLLFEWPVLLRYVPLHNAKIDLRFCWQLLRTSGRFLGIDGLLAVWACTNTLLLSWCVGESAVGVFGAAWQLLVPVTMTFQAIVNGLFPVMCRRVEEGPGRFRDLSVLLIEVMAIVAVPGCLLLYFGAAPIISTIYDNSDFSSSVVIMRIILPVLLLQAIVLSLGHVLYSQKQEGITLRIIAIDTAFNAVCGTLLIYSFGTIGAAVTVLLTWTMNTYLHIAAAHDWLNDDSGRPLRWHGTSLGSVLVAGSVMAAVLGVLHHSNFLFTSILTSIVYVIVLVALMLIAFGGPIGLRERFLLPLREQ